MYGWMHPIAGYSDSCCATYVAAYSRLKSRVSGDSIKRRRSIRAYRPEQIANQELEAILEAAIWAPSAMNQQKWHFTVIQNKDMLQRITDVAREIMKAGPERMAQRAASPELIFESEKGQKLLEELGVPEGKQPGERETVCCELEEGGNVESHERNS